MATELTEEQINRMAARAEDARELVLRLAAQFDGNWRMTIPPQVGDSDMVLNRVCDDLKALLAERKAMQAELYDYRNTITWGVDCAQCAHHLDKSYEDYNRIQELLSENEALKAMLRPSQIETFNLFRDAVTERDRYKSSLTELVTLKDSVKESDPPDYERRKPLAWEAARQAIALGQSVPMEQAGK